MKRTLIAVMDKHVRGSYQHLGYEADANLRSWTRICGRCCPSMSVAELWTVPPVPPLEGYSGIQIGMCIHSTVYNVLYVEFIYFLQGGYLNQISYIYEYVNKIE